MRIGFVVRGVIVGTVVLVTTPAYAAGGDQVLATPLPRGSTHADYRKAFPYEDRKGSWSIDEIGKPATPALSSVERAEVGLAIVDTPICERWQLRFAFPRIADGASERKFVIFKQGSYASPGSGGKIYFIQNQYIVYDFKGEGYLIAANAFATATPYPGPTPCNPIGY